ncbi:hypothetical protein BKA62DRAFT_188961 [Auriculariales sp. MPI-PUGE-AT-0066]|nr:hypothetical protein BKA62DRAFT_188961 [Auriculariales sp. MPI-PUGE-AT-0066]
MMFMPLAQYKFSLRIICLLPQRGASQPWVKFAMTFRLTAPPSRPRSGGLLLFQLCLKHGPPALCQPPHVVVTAASFPRVVLPASQRLTEKSLNHSG